ncbi:MAG: tetratricopeptide repeat protein [Alphaproteobacteria bacterium]|nr:tetratricopeptide repeat protein [Alphaproteobacteria bacterium]
MQSLSPHVKSFGIRAIARRLVVGAVCFAASFTVATQAFAISLIRDAEIEQTIRAYSTPVFEKAGLTPSSISLYIVNDQAINAFVMGGSNIFVNTGLIMQCPRPEMVIAVLAHETGHISGGHLVRSVQAAEKAQIQAVLGALLGAVAIAGGAGDAGMAILSGGQNMALRGMITHTRANEEAADNTALNILDQLGISASGMLETFEILRKQEKLKIGNSSDPYLRTHPLNTDRIMQVRNHVEQSKIPAGTVPERFVVLHQRMLGKLEGFLGEPAEVLTRYPETDSNVRAYYARAVAYFRQAKIDKAIAEMDTLISQSPNDPYFHELKGQILFEGSRIKEAAESYKKAVDLLPAASLIRVEYARALIALEDNSNLPEAIKHLEAASSNGEKENASLWRLLATAYGRSGQMGLSHLALAEEALALNDPETTLKQLELAAPSLGVATPAYLRAEDLRAQAKDRQKELKKK